MKEVTMYEARDGHTFKTEEECNQWEAVLDLKNLINAMFGTCHGLTSDDITDTIMENRVRLMEILRRVK